MLRAMPRATHLEIAVLSSLLALLQACDGGCSKAPSAPERTTPGAPAGEGNTRSPSDPGVPALTQETLAGEGGGLALHGEPHHPGRLVRVRVANTGTAPIELAAAMSIEREQGGSWSAVVGLGAITVRPSCEVEAPQCTTLAPGAELFPPDWLGTTGDAQCACEACVPVEHGVYRFVVSNCDGSRRFTGEPFTLE